MLNEYLLEESATFLFVHTQKVFETLHKTLVTMFVFGESAGGQGVGMDCHKKSLAFRETLCFGLGRLSLYYLVVFLKKLVA